MSLKKVNEFYSYLFFTVGATRIIYLVMSVLSMGANAAVNYSQGAVVSSSVNLAAQNIFALLLGIASDILIFTSPIMLIINLKKMYVEVALPYAWGILAFFLTYFSSSSFIIISFFIVSGIYMKAGASIRRKNRNYEEGRKVDKKMVKRTEWFYNESEETGERNSPVYEKNKKIEQQLQEDLEGWKMLLDSGEIDEATYNEETTKLINREKRKIEKNKRNNRK